nr:FAD-dependent oxidoreductase [Rhodoligotrophos defluvii]
MTVISGKAQGSGAVGQKVAVIGAGIIGVSCAFALQRRGMQVTLIDRLDPGEACSYGNAGVIATSSCLPLIMPGAIRNAPKWLLFKDGPLAIDWRHLPQTARWMASAVRYTAPAYVENTSRALRALHGGAVEDHFAQAREAACEDVLQRAPYLHVYETETDYRGDRKAWEMRRALGIAFEELDAAQLREVEPALAPIFVRGVRIEGHAIARNPGRLVKALAAAFAARQGRVVRSEVRAIRPTAGGVMLVTSEGEIEADQVVIAAGAWSAALAATLGHDFPLVAERGYHVGFANPGVALNHAVMFAERKMVGTSMEQGLRIAGTAEFSTVDRPPTPARAEAIERAAPRLFNGLNTAEPTRWMGARPSLPDTLPVIGRSHREPRLCFAFGHGHTGLTASATTARLIASIMAGDQPHIDITPFRTDRFPSRRNGRQPSGASLRAPAEPAAT